MILTGKRGATRPAVAEKKKPDPRTTPTGGNTSYRDAANKGYEPPLSAMEDWEGTEDGDPWQEISTRNRRWSTGRTPGTTPSSTPPQDRRNKKDKPPGPNPQFLHKHTTPCFQNRNEGSYRTEFDVEILTINGEPFRGTVTRQEAKHSIYRDALGCPFSNFRGVRLGYKTSPTVTFMLKQPINIDDFASFQNFTFCRSYIKGGQSVKDVLECKIRGVRTVSGDEATASYSDEWTRVVKIEGCDYKITEDMILSWLAAYGTIQSELVEDVFEDSEDSEGTNATGIYSVKIKLANDIPQLLPMDGRRIKIYYRGIRKLCTSCFGKHFRKDCNNEKVQWIDYVAQFVNDNPDFTKEQYGNWITILERRKKQDIINKEHFQSKQQPTEGTTMKEQEQEHEHVGGSGQGEEGIVSANDQPESQTGETPHESETQADTTPGQQEEIDEPKASDYKIPESDEDLAEMIDKLMDLGLSHTDAAASIEKRRKIYEKAVKKYFQMKSKKLKQSKSRKESQNDK